VALAFCFERTVPEIRVLTHVLTAIIA